MHFFQHDRHGVSGHASATALLFLPLTAIVCASWRPTARRTVGVLLTGWIVLVDGMRTALGMHHAWNVLLGTALGLGVGRVAVEVVPRSSRSRVRS